MWCLSQAAGLPSSSLLTISFHSPFYEKTQPQNDAKSCVAPISHEDMAQAHVASWIGHKGEGCATALHDRISEERS